MIYSYQEKNKFKHLLLDPRHHAVYRIEKRFDYQERLQWIKEHIGKHNRDWTVNSGLIRNGKKVYHTHFSYIERKDYGIWDRSILVVQWCFLKEEDALAFKLIWS